MNLHARSSLLALGTVALLAAGGCSGARSPILSVAGVERVDQTIDGTVVMISIDAENPGAEPLPLRDMWYEVRVGSSRFKGTRSPEATLRAFGTQRLTVPAVFPAGMSPEGPYVVSGSLTYLAPGEFAEALFDAGIRRPTVEFSGEGQVTAR